MEMFGFLSVFGAFTYLKQFPTIAINNLENIGNLVKEDLHCFQGVRVRSQQWRNSYCATLGSSALLWRGWCCLLSDWITAWTDHGAGSVQAFLCLGCLSAFIYIVNGHGVKKLFFTLLPTPSSWSVCGSNGGTKLSSNSLSEVALQYMSVHETWVPCFPGQNQS